MSDIIDLQSRRASVVYTVEVEHCWDGAVEVVVNDLDDSPRSNRAAARALRIAAKMVDDYAEKQEAEQNG
jgi:hypothetical protein